MSGLTSLVKAHDYDRYIATLFAPADKREALFSLYAFDAEVSRIADLVHDPMPGEIRLQWWRDVVNGGRDGEAAGHPVASVLSRTIAGHSLPREAFDAHCEAHIFDFYHDVMPDRTALETHLGATQSAIIQLAAMILDPEAARRASEAAGHAGVAKGIARILRDLPRIRGRGQGFVPLTILSAAGLSQDTFLGEAPADAGERLVQVFAALAAEHLQKFQAVSATLPKSIRPAFAPAAAISKQVSAIEKLSDPLRNSAEPSRMAKLWDVTRACF
jgi:15-cis-phytoene synthase